MGKIIIILLMHIIFKSIKKEIIYSEIYSYHLSLFYLRFIFWVYILFEENYKGFNNLK